MGDWTSLASGVYALVGVALLAFAFAHFVMFERRSIAAAGVVTTIVVVGVLTSAVVAFGLGMQPVSLLISYASFAAAWWYAKQASARLF